MLIRYGNIMIWCHRVILVGFDCRWVVGRVDPESGGYWGSVVGRRFPLMGAWGCLIFGVFPYLGSKFFPDVFKLVWRPGSFSCRFLWDSLWFLWTFLGQKCDWLVTVPDVLLSSVRNYWTPFFKRSARLRGERQHRSAISCSWGCPLKAWNWTCSIP